MSERRTAISLGVMLMLLLILWAILLASYRIGTVRTALVEMKPAQCTCTAAPAALPE